MKYVPIMISLLQNYSSTKSVWQRSRSRSRWIETAVCESLQSFSQSLVTRKFWKIADYFLSLFQSIVPEVVGRNIVKIFRGEKDLSTEMFSFFKVTSSYIRFQEYGEIYENSYYKTIGNNCFKVLHFVNPQVYLEPCQTCIMELFWQITERSAALSHIFEKFHSKPSGNF